MQSAFRSVDSDPADGYLQSSSPLSRLSRKSIAGNLPSAKSTRTGLRRSTRLSSSPGDKNTKLASDPPAVPDDDDDATIPEEPVAAEGDNQQEESVPEIAETVVEEPTKAAAASPEIGQAREIDDREAAHRLGPKRSRRNIPAPSPELLSEEAEEAEEEPVVKRPRKEAPSKKKKSPAKQRQPKAPRAKRSKKPEPSKRKSKSDASGAGAPVGVTVQRFTRIRPRGDGSDDEDDILNTVIPHSNREGVNAIDVLAQMCEEVIGKTVTVFKEEFAEADAATKRELKVKISSLGAFREELRTRLLEHVCNPLFLVTAVLDEYEADQT